MVTSLLPLEPEPELSLSRWRTRLMAILVLVGFVTSMAGAQVTGDGHPLKVMTRNLYQGTDFQEAMSSTDFLSFLSNVNLTLTNVAATKPDVRMAAIAQEVLREKPDILAVQEATIFLTGPDPYNLQPKYDLLQLLAGSLAQASTPYVPVNVVPQFQFAAPSITGEWVGTVTVIAILVRADALGSELAVSNPQGGVFAPDHTLKYTIPALGTELTINRGWASIDGNFQGRDFRFITAHPEAWAWQYDALQIGDVLAGAANTTLPVILAADFNTDAAANPSDTSYVGYGEMLAAGLVDSWPTSYPIQAHFTCCQNNDLKNTKSLLSQRIDLIMTRGFTAAETKVVGDNIPSMVDGLWPSDHAGVVTKLRFQE